MDTFASLGLSEALAGGLASLGFPGPTPVQASAIPILRAGRDLLMESETGTGKTFAYLAPALELCSGDAGHPSPLALVAAPTQELAVQIGREAERLAAASGLGLRSVVLLGGSPLSRQASLLHGRPGLVVGTLGRLADLVAMGGLRLKDLKLLILDEADRLLVPETEEAATTLLSKVPHSCARALVSATLPKKTRDKAAPFLRNPGVVEVSAERPVLAGTIEHWCFYCDGRKRLDFLRRLEAALEPPRCLVFLSTAARVESAAERLVAMGLPAAGIHAKLDKEERRVSLERFAEGKLRYLVTSDLGARGLDIAGISHVVSLDLPEEQTVYIHRAGRTGRAGATGVSIVLADGVELKRASRLAVKEGFTFHCRFLEAGKVIEPTSEEFFERAERAESEKEAHRGRRMSEGPKPSRDGERTFVPRGSYAHPREMPRPQDREERKPSARAYTHRPQSQPTQTPPPPSPARRPPAPAKPRAEPRPETAAKPEARPEAKPRTKKPDTGRGRWPRAKS